MLSTAQDQLVPAIRALGLDSRAVIEQGEVDPIVYLLVQAGADLGYRFEWERYGPFSSALGADLVDLTAEDLEEPFVLDARLTDAVASVRGIIEPDYPGLRSFTWIRLLASVHFLTTYSGLQLRNGDRPPYLQNPPFEQRMIDAAIDRLGRLAT
jgi:hypothetical protein